MMTKQMSLNTLWNSAISKDRVFHSDKLSHLPEAARQYLKHAIAPGTAIASAVRLQMHGEIKLKNWIPFKAEQVICWEHGLIWSATAWMNGLPIVGSDRIIDGIGAMQWKLLGIFPVMIASGSDITRSAVGRLQSESVCLPSALCGDGVSWTTMDSSHLHSSFVVQGERAELDFRDFQEINYANKRTTEAQRTQREEKYRGFCVSFGIFFSLEVPYHRSNGSAQDFQAAALE
ncbi:MAG: DUF6544 family protein [Nostoc sp.]|uniref:DUF6920 family protein n=1 Tax=Nostoc sp. TaxID=1180 RepID=UPI002FFCD5EF